MAKSDSLQLRLFNKVRERIPAHSSPVDTVAEILNISTDGVYRRFRGETPLRLEEAAKLCRHFNLSLDALALESSSETYLFNPSGLGMTDLDFEEYLQNILTLLGVIHGRGVQRTIFAAKDIPVFHLFQFPQLVLFKIFFWRKTIFNDPDLEHAKFEFITDSEKMQRCISLSRQIAEKYSLIPTTEIWNEETAASILKQIGYYYESGLFKNREDALQLTEHVEQYFAHLRQEAERGYKFMAEHPPQNRVENFELYFNDLVLIDNVIHIQYPQSAQTFLVYHSIEYLSTENPVFCQQVEEWLETLTRKSEPISKVSERMRNRFFMRIQRRIDELKGRLS